MGRIKVLLKAVLFKLPENALLQIGQNDQIADPLF